MINFGDVLIHEGNKLESVKFIKDSTKIPEGKFRLDFSKDVLKKKPKLSKQELHLIEPGNKIPVGQFLQVGMFCEECGDVEAHAVSTEKKKIRCLKCKTTRYFK